MTACANMMIAHGMTRTTAPAVNRTLRAYILRALGRRCRTAIGSPTRRAMRA